MATLLAGGKVISLGEAQRRAAAIIAVYQFGKERGGIYWDAVRDLERPVKVLSNLGSYSDGTFKFTDPDSAEKAVKYLESVDVISGVGKVFSVLDKEIVVYRAPISEAYQPLTEVKITPAIQLAVEAPEAYEKFKLLADAYGVKWGVGKRGKPKPLPKKLVEKAHTIIEFVKAWEGVQTSEDTALKEVVKKDIKTKVMVGFKKSAELFQGYLLADSVFQIYNIEGKESPFKKKVEEELKDLKREAEFLRKYLLGKEYVYEPAKKELVTGPGGEQMIKKVPEKRGTRWDFIKWFLPELVEPTRKALAIFGEKLP